MIHLTQLSYVWPGQEETYRRFEDSVAPILERHGAQMLLRLRPEAAQVVSATVELPYEIHVVSFGSEADLEAYLSDEDRVALLPLREQSVRAAMLFPEDPRGILRGLDPRDPR